MWGNRCRQKQKQEEEIERQIDAKFPDQSLNFWALFLSAIITIVMPIVGVLGVLVFLLWLLWK